MSFIEASLNSSRPAVYFQMSDFTFSIESTKGYDTSNLNNVTDLRVS